MIIPIIIPTIIPIIILASQVKVDENIEAESTEAESTEAESTEAESTEVACYHYHPLLMTVRDKVPLVLNCNLSQATLVKF